MTYKQQGVKAMPTKSNRGNPTRAPKKKPLPVGLSDEQHKYLESQSIGKAEYMRNLLVIDMEKNK